MSNFQKKEQNLIQLIDKLNSISLSYSQPSSELEKIKTEKNQLDMFICMSLLIKTICLFVDHTLKTRLSLLCFPWKEKA